MSKPLHSPPALAAVDPAPHAAGAASALLAGSARPLWASEAGAALPGAAAVPGGPIIQVPAGLRRAAMAPGSAWAPGQTAVANPVHQALAERVKAALAQGVHGLCFSPYVEGQQPGDQVSEAQVRERLKRVRPHTRWVRSFSCIDGHEHTPAIAHGMGLKTLVGAWLGQDEAVNAQEVEGLIRLARAGHADIVAVGNEVLLREDMPEDTLLAWIQQVKDALSDRPAVPVGYVDAYYLFEQHPRITAACDVVLTNCYPFWEGCPREQALAYMQRMLARTRAAAPGKRVVISETGWPDRGSAFHGSLPSPEGAMAYFADTMDWAAREEIELFYFAAYDEAWKVESEGDVGAYWGLWDKDARFKYP